MNDRTTLVAITSILYFATAFGYSIGNIPFTAYIVRNRTLPTFAGIQFYAGGFFDHQGIDWVIAASFLLHLVSFAFFPVGYWLWNSVRLGGIVALVLFPVAMAIFLGAGAPYPPIVETLKVALVLFAWASLK